MHAPGSTGNGAEVEELEQDFESVFRSHYDRIAYAIARVVGDAACADELAGEVFWRFWRNPQVQGERLGGWLYRTAIHLAVGELRRRARHLRYQRLLRFASPSNPEELHAAAREQEQVRQVLGSIKPGYAELLLLRADDFSYEELAAALRLNPASVGTLISRARREFRKEYTKRYGEPRK